MSVCVVICGTIAAVIIIIAVVVVVVVVVAIIIVIIIIIRRSGCDSSGGGLLSHNGCEIVPHMTVHSGENLMVKIIDCQDAETMIHKHCWICGRGPNNNVWICVLLMWLGHLPRFATESHRTTQPWSLY